MAKRKNPNGKGSVYQVGRGKWKVALTVQTISGKRKRITRNAKSQRHGQVVLQELREKYSGRVSEPTQITFAEFLSRWLRDDVEGAKESTLAAYQSSIDNHIVPRLGKVRLQKFNALHATEWLSELKASGAGDRTRQQAYTIVKSALKYGCRLGLLAENCMNNVPRPKVTAEEPRPFTLREVQLILNHTRKDRLHALYQLALTTGMRQGELFGLEWGDVDFKESQISIRRQVTEVKGRLVIDTLKTKSSRRTIVATAITMAALADRRKLAFAEGHAGVRQVFVTPMGKLIRRTNFSRRNWKHLLKRLGLGHRGMHHCRHTAATMMLQNASVHVVSRILGHATPSITLNIYSHFMPEDGQLAAAAMAHIGAKNA